MPGYIKYTITAATNLLLLFLWWPVRKENEVTLRRAKIRIVRWMCDVKVKDRVLSKEMRDRLGKDDIILVLQQSRLRWACAAKRRH